MQRQFYSWIMAMLATLCCCSLASAQSARTAPTRVNTSTVRTTSGGSLFQAIRPRESATDYRGGFLHIYPGHNMQRAAEEGSVDYAQFSQEESPETDLLPPLPANGNNAGEEVMGIMDPTIDEPVFADSPVLGSGAMPVDGFIAADCGPCKAAHGKGKHGHIGFHDWNWACFCIPLPPEDNLSFNAGVQGFKGPLNGALDGSFGFHEGFNLGAALPGCNLGIGWQIGLQGVQSNLPGQGFASSSDRSQVFFTWGFFRRVDYGLQGGFVFDHMHDHFVDDVHLDQTRGELSWVTQCCAEFGVFFNVSDENYNFQYNNNIIATVDGTDVVAFFYRQHFGSCRQSWGRIYVGATEKRGSFANYLGQADDFQTHSNFLFGADMHVSLSDCWSLETGFTWLAAASDDNVGAFEDSWNVGFNLIWYPRGHCCGTKRGYYRPLFNVADNGSFLTHVNSVRPNN